MKIRIVVPDHRHSPLMAGAIRTHAGVGFDGIRPSATIGSEKTIRISFASCSCRISPVGPALRTAKGGGLGEQKSGRQRNEARRPLQERDA